MATISLAEPEQDGHRLGRRERQIEAGDFAVRGAAKPCPRQWVTVGQHGDEIVAVDLAGQAEQLGAATDPPARHLAAEVVVLDTTGDRAEVVLLTARGEDADVQHWLACGAAGGIDDAST